MLHDSKKLRVCRLHLLADDMVEWGNNCQYVCCGWEEGDLERDW